MPTRNKIPPTIADSNMGRSKPMATSPAPTMTIQIAKIITVTSYDHLFPSKFASTITLALTAETIAVSQDSLLPPKAIARRPGRSVQGHKRKSSKRAQRVRLPPESKH